MREYLLNEMTGETLTMTEYVAQARQLEKDIFRLDRTIDDLKSSLKAAKEDHSKAVSALRANAREIRLRSKPTAMRSRPPAKEVKS